MHLFCVLPVLIVVASAAQYEKCAPGYHGRQCEPCQCTAGTICDDGIAGTGQCLVTGIEELSGDVEGCLGNFSLVWNNTFVRELPADAIRGNYVRQVARAAFSFVTPTPVADPVLISVNLEVVEILGIAKEALSLPGFVEFAAGNAVIGNESWAHAYAGHQFGVNAGQLGDGRAISLGELVAPATNGSDAGQRWELQLKGAGRTPYSRRGDGRAVLRSSVREYLCSAAMAALGVPGSLALSLVGSSTKVVRDMFYNGNMREERAAVVLRVAPSWVRFGSFELPFFRREHDLIRQLAEYVIKYHFPHLTNLPDRVGRMFDEAVRLTAVMVAGWQAYGFSHGVMNTDNMSILGITIDYGPFGFLDAYDPNFIPNTSDDTGRYRFSEQPRVALWNLHKLAAALAPISDGDLTVGLDVTYGRQLAAEYLKLMRRRLGLSACPSASLAVHNEGSIGDVEFDFGGTSGDETDKALVDALKMRMRDSHADHGLVFRDLLTFAEAVLSSNVEEPKIAGLSERAWRQWLASYRERLLHEAQFCGGSVAILDRMRTSNPIYVLRNYSAQLAIARAELGDYAPLRALLAAVSAPFREHSDADAFGFHRPPPVGAEKVAVSCSS